MRSIPERSGVDKAYGETRYTWGTTPTDYRFTGQRQTESLGLYHMGARWYDPYLGRWLSPDTIIPQPANPQSLNRYSYCLGNPLKYADREGHVPVLLVTAAAGALVGGVVDLGKQLVVDQKDIRDVNWAEVGGAAAGGFVAGLTLGLAPAGASAVGVALLGGLGGAAGSQVQALTQAELEELLGTNPQGSVIEEAMDLGFLDPATIAINTGVGALMGTVGDKFAGWLRGKLPLPESANVIRSSGKLPMVRWQTSLEKPGAWTVQMEGRTVNIDPAVFEKLVRSLAMGFYDVAEQIVKEAFQQGLIEVIEEATQP